MGTYSSNNSTDVVYAVVSVQAKNSISNNELVEKADSSSSTFPSPTRTQRFSDQPVEKSDSFSRASPTPTPTQCFPNYNQLLKAIEDPKNRSLERALPLVSTHQLVSLKNPPIKNSLLSKKEDSDSSIDTCITPLYDGKLSPLVVDHLDTGNIGPIKDDSNHLEATCQELVSTLVSIDKEARDNVQTLLSNWEESERMSAIYDHARSASKEIVDDLSTLAAYLAKNLDNSDLAKAFAIYVWICTKISFNKSIHTKQYSRQESYTEAKRVLSSRSSNCVGYSTLFAELAKLAGIKAKVIRGEISHVPNPALPANEARTSTAVPHTWNMIKLDNVWFPVDCTFGANYFEKSMELRYNYICHFFATPPSTLILTHWPTKKKWQLLQTPVNREALDPLIILPSCAAGRGARPLTWRRSIVVSDEHQHSTVIELTAHLSLKIGAKLLYMNEHTLNYEEVTGKNLLCIQRNKDIVCIRAALPFKGSYSLLLTINKEKRRESRVPQVFLSYHITHMSEPFQQIGYPKVDQMAASAYNFRLLFWNQSPHDCICESDSKQLDLGFVTKRRMTCLHFLVPGKAQNTRPEDHSVVYNYNTMVVTETDDADSEHCLRMLKVVFPAEGWWTICLNGTKGNPNQSLCPYVTLMSYQVYAHQGDSNSTFPYVISPQVSICCFDPMSCVSESIDIPFTTTKPLEFQAYLMEKKPNAPELESYVRIKQAELVSLSSNQYRLTAMFPKPGQWHVHVFARPEEDNKTLRGLFSVFVTVETPMQGALSVALSSTTAEKIQLSFPNKGYLSFPDIGKPLTIDFECGKNTSFQHWVFPEDRDEKTLEEYKGLSLLEHCTYLTPLNPPVLSSSFRPILLARQSLTQPTHLCEITSYKMYASFPWAGKWTLEVFAQAPGSSDYSLAFHVTMNVTKPSRGICYPLLHAGFDQFGIRIPNESICYNPISTESTDFELPFNSPDDIQFTWSIEVAGSDSCYKKQGFVYQSRNSLGPSTNHFQLSFSTPGIWRAVLYAKKSTPEDSIPEENIYKPVLEISLLVNTVDKDVGLPEIFPAFKKYGLSIAKMHIPFLSHVQSNTSTTVIVSLFNFCTGNVKFFHRVDCAERTEEENQLLPRSQMLEDTCSGLNEILVEITEPGTYKIQLGAQWMDCKENNYEPVLTHTVTCSI